MIDVSEVISFSEHTKVYIIDSHRPIHLSNLFADQQVAQKIIIRLILFHIKFILLIIFFDIDSSLG